MGLLTSTLHVHIQSCLEVTKVIFNTPRASGIPTFVTIVTGPVGDEITGQPTAILPMGVWSPGVVGGVVVGLSMVRMVLDIWSSESTATIRKYPNVSRPTRYGLTPVGR